jgi:hypothetical protein
LRLRSCLSSWMEIHAVFIFCIASWNESLWKQRTIEVSSHCQGVSHVSRCAVPPGHKHTNTRGRTQIRRACCV